MFNIFVASGATPLQPGITYVRRQASGWEAVRKRETSKDAMCSHKCKKHCRRTECQASCIAQMDADLTDRIQELEAELEAAKARKLQEEKDVRERIGIREPQPYSQPFIITRDVAPTPAPAVREPRVPRPQSYERIRRSSHNSDDRAHSPRRRSARGTTEPNREDSFRRRVSVHPLEPMPRRYDFDHHYYVRPSHDYRQYSYTFDTPYVYRGGDHIHQQSPTHRHHLHDYQPLHNHGHQYSYRAQPSPQPEYNVEEISPHTTHQYRGRQASHQARPGNSIDKVPFLLTRITKNAWRRGSGGRRRSSRRYSYRLPDIPSNHGEYRRSSRKYSYVYLPEVPTRGDGWPRSSRQYSYQYETREPKDYYSRGR